MTSAMVSLCFCFALTFERNVSGRISHCLSLSPSPTVLGFIDFGWDKLSEAAKLEKRAKELNQGRAAQMGILALMVHEQLGVSLIPSV